jgi:CubicO group peptidase (beta-lactamase class C family)
MGDLKFGMEARILIRRNGEEDAIGVTASVPWWSFTKTAFAIAMPRLSEQGKVGLDEAVAGKPYTPAQLLRHEAGLPDYGSLASYHADVEAGQAPWSVDDLLSAVEAHRLRYEPGQGWAYSNIGYREVAQLIEKASDRPLADALAELVFGQLLGDKKSRSECDHISPGQSCLRRDPRRMGQVPGHILFCIRIGR